MKHRKLEWTLIGALVIICVGLGIWMYLPRGGDAIAVISVDSQELTRIDLAHAEDQIWSIQTETGKPVSFEIADHQIRFVNVTCPDHVCEQAGWVSAPGQRAVCMPNRTTLICYAPDELS